MNSKKRILIFHFDLQGGGAEKVLVNLLRNLDYNKYDVTLQTVFGVGVNKKDLPPEVHFKCIFKKIFNGVTRLMRLLSPTLLHRLVVRENYDLEVAFLESSPTRIVSGCRNKATRTVAWVHTTFSDLNARLVSYRSHDEAVKCYNQFDKVVFVSRQTLEVFKDKMPGVTTDMTVIHNVNDMDAIYDKAGEPCPIDLPDDCINIVAIGRLIPVKGFDRLINAAKKLKDKDGVPRFNIHILGQGAEHDNLARLISDNCLEDTVHLLGFDSNPYKYISHMDLFVCSSHREGYSTATSEAVALGIPVLTTACSGMDEILEDGKYGLIVDNTDEALYDGLERLVTTPAEVERYKTALADKPRITTQSLVDEYQKLFDTILSSY